MDLVIVVGNLSCTIESKQKSLCRIENRAYFYPYTKCTWLSTMYFYH